MAIGVGKTFRSGVAQSQPRKSAGKPEPVTKALPYGQRIALFGVRAVLLGPKSPLVARKLVSNPAEAPRVQRVDADAAPFEVADMTKG